MLRKLLKKQGIDLEEESAEAHLSREIVSSQSDRQHEVNMDGRGLELSNDKSRS